MRHCFSKRGHGGLVIGSEMSGGVRNVTVSNCVFDGTKRGIRFKAPRGRGGTIENVVFNGIVFAALWGIMFREDVHKWVKNNIAKGLLYGLIMTIISAGPLVPYAYVPEQGYGLFLFDGPDGWKLPFGILIWHLIYGLFLGLLWNPTDDEAVA